ncbi:tetratricopeptide repeat protein [Candidatus Hodarchaeum mangrovi]
MSQIPSKGIDFSSLPPVQIMVHVPNDEIRLKIYWIKYADKIIKEIGKILEKIVDSKMYYHLGCINNKKSIVLKLCLACRNGNLYIIQERKGTLKPILLQFDFEWRLFLRWRVRVKLLRGSFPILSNGKEKREKKENINQSSINYQLDYPTEWFNIGVLLQKENQYKEAEKAYQKAIKKDPSFALAWNNLGVMLVNQGDYTRAEAAYRKPFELDPYLAIAWYNLGNRLVVKNLETDAEAAYRKAIELEPDYLKAKVQLDQLLLNKKQENEIEELLLSS